MFSSSHARADPLMVAVTAGSYIPGVLRVHGVHIGLNSGFPQNVRKRWYKVLGSHDLRAPHAPAKMAECIERDEKYSEWSVKHYKGSHTYGRGLFTNPKVLRNRVPVVQELPGLTARPRPTVLNSNQRG